MPKYLAISSCFRSFSTSYRRRSWFQSKGSLSESTSHRRSSAVWGSTSVLSVADCCSIAVSFSSKASRKASRVRRLKFQLSSRRLHTTEVTERITASVRDSNGTYIEEGSGIDMGLRQCLKFLPTLFPIELGRKSMSEWLVINTCILRSVARLTFWLVSPYRRQMAGCLRHRKINTTAALILCFLPIVCTRATDLSFPMINDLFPIKSISRRQITAGDYILKKRSNFTLLAREIHPKKANNSFYSCDSHIFEKCMCKLVLELWSLRMNR